MADDALETTRRRNGSRWTVAVLVAAVALAAVAVVRLVSAPDNQPAAPATTRHPMTMAPGHMMMTPGPMATTEAAGGAPKAVMVHLGELVIDPNEVTVAEGGTLQVMNVGTMGHRLAIDGTALATKTLNADGAEDLVLGGLPAGDYKLTCPEPGHEQAGMSATLHVVPRNG